ncbi:hypothetical protein KUM_1296 [Taylorella asinigenitalis 14/45]|uniref:Uncharacterized protein n=1 Tax=Taylorella asinigenitalis 14/45 TaxID=1091495 RepID=I7IC77_9BURK|nr:hypothetical protein KUM_1296 [Taylorella asinigenitalis 14/45]
MELILGILQNIFIIGISILGFLLVLFLILIAFIFGGFMFIANKLTGRAFSFGDYMKRTRSKAVKTQKDFAEKFRHPTYSRRDPEEITDVDFVETKTK